MTSCTGTPAEQFLEAYLQGTLPDSDAISFEEHYFDCPVCLAKVEALQAVSRKLAEQPREPIKKPIPWPTHTVVRLGAFAAIAALLLLGFFAFRFRSESKHSDVAATTPPTAPPSAPANPGTQSRPSQMTTLAVSRLADLTLPAFQAANLRGQSRDAHFDAGMKEYSSHACQSAIKDLSQVPAQDQDAAAAKFYGGICQMRVGNLPRARVALVAVADAGDSPQQEAAFYYLAQTALLGNDSAAARRNLKSVIALHGDFEARAKAQLTQLPSPERR
jgi:hypothetical protein